MPALRLTFIKSQFPLLRQTKRRHFCLLWGYSSLTGYTVAARIMGMLRIMG